MSRLTEKEIELIHSARAARRREPVSADDVMQKARVLQSEAVADGLGRILYWTGLPEIGGWLYDRLLRPAVVALRRRRTVQQLRRLDDHLLRDIGLERGLVESFGENLNADVVARRRATDGPIARCRRWLKRQRMIKDLRALSDRQLDDIGVVRGDIEDIVNQTMRKAERAPRRRGVSALTVQGFAQQALSVTPPLSANDLFKATKTRRAA